MASIQSLGAGSGLLTSALVDEIVASERAVTDLRIQAERFGYEAELSAFGSLRAATEKLQGSVDALNNPSAFSTLNGTVSDDSVLGISVASTADVGSHTIEVSQLATAHVIASKGFADAQTATGTGTLTFQFGTTTFSGGNYDTFTVNPDIDGGVVTIDATNNTLDGVRDAINQADLGVNASLIDDGSGIRLVLTSAETGEDLSMQVVVAEGTQPGLSAFAFSSGAATPGVNMQQTVAAQDAELTIDGIDITSNSNSVNGALGGVTLSLTSTNVGSPASISVQRDTDAVVGLINSFVNDFNGLLQVTSQLTAFDPETEVAGLLLGDPTIRAMIGQLRRALNEQVTALGSGSAQSLVDVGIRSNQANGFSLEFDSSKLTAALSADVDAVSGLFAEFGFSSSSAATVVGTTPLTQPGQYSFEVIQPATQGFQRGAATTLNAGIDIDADNDELTLIVDGVTSDPIVLTLGTYADGDAVAAELQTQIDADGKLSGKDVIVSYDSATQRLQITSGQYGSSSQVAVDAVDTNTLAELGLGVDDGGATAGLDVEGRIGGIPASGVDQVLVAGSALQAATAGQFRGGVSASDTGPVTLDASNNNFVIEVDGVTSGTITLTEQAYADGAALASELQAQINADVALSGASKSVTVAFNANTGRFAISSDTIGTASSVAFDSVPAATDTVFAFGSGKSYDGTAAQTVVSKASGLSLKTENSKAGSTGNITFTQGVMSVFASVLDVVNKSDGSIDSRLDSLEARLTDLDEEEARFSARITAFEARLRTQFAAADALISQLNTTSDFLLQQISLLPLSNLNRK